MRTVRKFATTLWDDRRGQDFLEYVLVCAFMAVAVVSSWGAAPLVANRLGAALQALAAVIAQFSSVGSSGY